MATSKGMFDDFSSHQMIWREEFDESIPTCAFFFFLLLKWLQLMHTSSTCKPGLVHSSSARWDDCGRAFPGDVCLWAHFKECLHRQQKRVQQQKNKHFIQKYARWHKSAHCKHPPSIIHICFILYSITSFRLHLYLYHNVVWCQASFSTDNK